MANLTFWNRTTDQLAVEVHDSAEALNGGLGSLGVTRR